MSCNELSGCPWFSLAVGVGVNSLSLIYYTSLHIVCFTTYTIHILKYASLNILYIYCIVCLTTQGCPKQCFPSVTPGGKRGRNMCVCISIYLSLSLSLYIYIYILWSINCTINDVMFCPFIMILYTIPYFAAGSAKRRMDSNSGRGKVGVSS